MKQFKLWFALAFTSINEAGTYADSEDGKADAQAGKAPKLFKKMNYYDAYRSTLDLES